MDGLVNEGFENICFCFLSVLSYTSYFNLLSLTVKYLSHTIGIVLGEINKVFFMDTKHFQK